FVAGLLASGKAKEKTLYEALDRLREAIGLAPAHADGPAWRFLFAEAVDRGRLTSPKALADTGRFITQLQQAIDDRDPVALAGIPTGDRPRVRELYDKYKKYAK